MVTKSDGHGEHAYKTNNAKQRVLGLRASQTTCDEEDEPVISMKRGKRKKVATGMEEEARAKSDSKGSSAAPYQRVEGRVLAPDAILGYGLLDSLGL